ncbi:hypothetical protein FF011L_51450 [Roseimaritima multifibrata]|uniref:Uncharacterized protein n=1 Tax=Roseimaritima multifibrata TaxID=1930274 RepID=A0A517MNH2_9BACT|nr:PEP-CTERM sorting domain-containing protein [Roseimaritima multifibrata]QDS96337.1 hypothetical protein FF011L_51450 [Roseimaritima multifibrata]
MKMKVLAIQAILMLAVCVQANAGGVFPQIDGGPFDSVENDLAFSVTGGLVTMDGLGVADVGGGITVNYMLTGNDGGPVGNLTVEFVGTIGALTGAGPFIGNLVTGTATVLGDGFDELNLTVTDGYLQLAASSSLYLGFSATTVDPPIEPGSISFIPVSFDAPGFFSSTSDFFLGSGSSANGSSFNVNFTTGVVGSGVAQGLVNPVPEPASILTLLGCVAGACVMGRRRRKVAAA